MAPPLTMWCILLLAILIPGSTANYDWDEVTELDTYVHSDDGYYTVTPLIEYRYTYSTLYVVNMTSQKWQDETYVDYPVWWHVMGICVPDAEYLTYPDAGLMFIDGGSNSRGDTSPDPPGENDDGGRLVCAAAVDIGCIGAYIKSLPNQPLVFENDPTKMSRKEDSIIAWTWRTYIDSVKDGDPVNRNVILRMPMTKAAKRGLDTIDSVAMAQTGVSVQNFVVTGASKRGWTTWSIAATDKRVKAIAPMVFSLLNFNQTLMAHFQGMDGAWSFAFESYYRENLTEELLNPEAVLAFEVEDMYYYRPRLTMPIHQLVSTGDEFFLCQDSHYWWAGIDAHSSFLTTYMMHNAEHAMIGHYVEMYQTVTSWWREILENNMLLPDISWTFRTTETKGYIDVVSNFYLPPTSVIVWAASTLVNDTRRDFRLAQGSSSSDISFHPVIWHDDIGTLVQISASEWTASVNILTDEWIGFIVEFNYPDEDGRPMWFTTQTHIVPETFPTPPCTTNAACKSVMV